MPQHCLDFMFISGLFQLTIVFNMIFYKPPSLDDYYYNDSAQALGWCIGMFPIFLIVSFFLWSFCRNGGFSVSKMQLRDKFIIQ